VIRQLPTTDATHFTPAQRRQVEVLLEAILPGTDTAPGATDANAAGFVDALLANDPEVFYEITEFRKTYEAALPALDAAATQRFGAPLAELDTAQATELLSGLSKGELEGLPEELDQKKTFATLRAHTIEGSFSDPRWGGNREGIVWRWIGYPEEPRDFRRSSSGALEEVRGDA
jgi:hypothetical protein